MRHQIRRENRDQQRSPHDDRPKQRGHMAQGRQLSPGSHALRNRHAAHPRNLGSSKAFIMSASKVNVM